jgi:hypothetical protein
MVMASCELSLQFMNGTPDTTFILTSYSGISQPPPTIEPGVTTYPPDSATSPFQILGNVSYADSNGGGFNVHFYIPVMGSNDFKITSNPEGRYTGSFVGSTKGWGSRRSHGSSWVPETWTSLRSDDVRSLTEVWWS